MLSNNIPARFPPAFFPGIPDRTKFCIPGCLPELIPEIESVEMVKDNEDGTKQYTIISKADTDLRKKLFDVLPKQDITIFELKKTETTLEDAFIKLIDTKKEGEK